MVLDEKREAARREYLQTYAQYTCEDCPIPALGGKVPAAPGDYFTFQWPPNAGAFASVTVQQLLKHLASRNLKLSGPDCAHDDMPGEKATTLKDKMEEMTDGLYLTCVREGKNDLLKKCKVH